METNKISRQSRSDESNPQKHAKGHSNPRSTTGTAAQGQPTGGHASTKKNRRNGEEHSGDRVDIHKTSSQNVAAPNDQSNLPQPGGESRVHSTPGYTGSGGANGRKIEKPLSIEMTPHDAAEHSAALSGSGGMYQVHSSQSPEANQHNQKRGSNQVQSSQSTVGGYLSAATTQKGNHLSNKSETNINANGTTGNQNLGSNSAHGHGKSTGANQHQNRSHMLPGESKKKRKSSEKRRASNNKRAAAERDEYRHQNGGMIPPIEGGTQSSGGHMGSGGGHPRSHSRGTAVSQHSAGQNQQQQQNMQQQFYDPSVHYNPFGQQQNNQAPQGFPMGMGGPPGFPFGANGTGPFMGGNQQAPQVHFIAKKQQFIAQISPEQLVSSDKRPYTAQSLHNLSANAKRAGSVYANAGNPAKGGHGSATYNIANAAFTNYPAAYLGGMGGAKTHTSGFSFHPGAGGNNKYSASVYGEDVKPKVAGKDILHALASSNGFSSGYHSDPYNSVMSSGLPTTLSHSTRPTKSKASHNRLNAKEKEQLYDETIKMKVLNNQMKEDAVKLKTKVKILENELTRKEKTIEDLFSQNQLISASHSKQPVSTNSGVGLLPLAQTAHKYQQETFLVMSLKKQIRELKYEVAKRDEELEILRKNMKNTRTKELEQEIEVYHEECLRLRSVTEDLIKQGASHPIHQQTYMERVNRMQAELSHKDMVIQQLSEQLNGQMAMDKVYASAHSSSSNTNALMHGTHSSTLAGVRSQESQGFEAQQSDMHQGSAPTSSHNMGGREKSVEKKHPLAGGAGPQGSQKDVAKELQRAKKQLREKEKEMVKMRQEVTQMRRESQEKLRNDNQQNKDTEGHMKTLRDKLKESKSELKRKDEKLVDQEAKLKQIQNELKILTENHKAQEDQNKQLKSQLRAAKNAKPKEASSSIKAGEAAVSKTTEPTPEQKPKKAASNPTSTAKPTEEKPPQPKIDLPKNEMALITLIGQREKLSRDDLTAMILAGEESLRMLIRKPSDNLIDYIKSNLDEEDAILSTIPRFEMPKADFETQVLREMRVVLRENAEVIDKKTDEELMNWDEFSAFYSSLDNFDYPHKDKLLEFIKYFFLDHIESEYLLYINFAAFKEHVLARPRPAAGATGEKSRNDGSLRSRRRGSEDSAGSFTGQSSAEDALKKRLLAAPEEEAKSPEEEERMLDIAEQCFMRIADLLHLQQKTVRQIFLKYSQPEQFKDGQVLELLSPRGFLEGVRDTGFEDVTEMEAACLMKVLAKPELDNAVILNEFVLIMENFGIPALGLEEDEYENDYMPDTDEEEDKAEKTPEATKDENPKDPKAKKEDAKKEDAKTDDSKAEKAELQEKHSKFAEDPKRGKKQAINIKFEDLDEKGNKILKRLARFLLERYMHPREFFGPTIKKEVFGKKKCKVEIIKLQDFYLRLKLASIRKKLKDIPSLTSFLAIDHDKHPGYVQVKRMIKALEIIAEREQELMIKEQEEKDKLEKEKAEKEAAERAAKGLPPLTPEEIEAAKLEKLAEEEKAKEKDSKDGKDKDPLGKPPKGSLDEMLKLQGKASPKGAEKPDGKTKFASHLGPQTQLNTIEEDLHETQTSHYSYQVKEGENSDRDGSRHQLSTSNHLRNSNVLHEVDGSRQSINGMKGGLTMGQSVNSGDYSGGSGSSKKKAKDIDGNDITIQDFKKIERNKSDLQNLSERVNNQGADSLRNKSIKEELHEEDPATSYLDQPRGSRTSKQQAQVKTQNIPTVAIQQSQEPSQEDDAYESQFDAVGDQILANELEAVVDQKLQKTFDTQKNILKEDNDDDDNYEDDEDHVDELKQDTIKTDKIEQIVEQDMHDSQRLNKDLQNQERISQDDLDIGAVKTEVKKGNHEQIEDYEEADEYSYHDDESVNSNRQQQQENRDMVATKPAQQNQESDIEEDYEF